MSLRDPAGTAELLVQMIQDGHYEEAAEALSAGLGARAFHDAIDDCFGDHHLEGVILSGAASLLPGLAYGPVITTNFDHVVERAFEKQGGTFQQVVWGAKIDVFVEALQQNRKFLLKIHGDVEDRTERVLTASEYERNYAETESFEADAAPLLHRLLYSIMTNRSLLFLGCSLNNDRTMAVLRQAARNMPGKAHYAVMQEPSLAESVSRTQFLSDHCIRPIWYPRSRHEFIEPLLSHLIEQTRRDFCSKGLNIIGTYFVPKLAINDHGTRPTNCPPIEKKNRILRGSDDPSLRHRSGFLGRKVEVEKVLRFLNWDGPPELCNDSGGICGVSGSAGIGKTEICKEALKQRLCQYPASKVYSVDLVDARNQGDFVARLAEAMGYGEPANRSSVLQFISTTADIVYLDNLEDILVDEASVEFLTQLGNIPKVKVLASSRETVPGIARNIPVHPLNVVSCVQLFLRQWERSSDSIVNDCNELREFLEDDLGRHPLSIVLVAAQAYQHHSLRSLRQSWQQDALGLAKIPRVEVSNLTSLEISLTRLLQALERVSPEAIKVWGLIAMFPQGLSSSAWTARAGNSSLFKEIRGVLLRLSIVQIDENGSLNMLPPIRRFILHKAELQESGLSGDLLAEGAYIHYLGVAREAFKHSKDESHQLTLDQLLSEFPNICHFFSFAAPLGSKWVHKLSALSFYLLNFFQYRLDLSRHTLAYFLPYQYQLQLFKEAGETSRVLGDLESRVGNLGTARSLYRDAIKLFKLVNDADGVCRQPKWEF